MKWEPLRKEQYQPKKIDSLLDSLLHKLSGSSTKAINKVIENWQLIIGENFSKISHPTHIKDKTLYIQVIDAAIAQELEWRTTELIKTVNMYTKEEPVTSLKITIKKM
ncbi:MAG: hypothetical protein CL431_03225 [Acidimicrobiaceae bacterium]|jgi:hypothetical protein|nr:hypothetical protein [Acidimicrobiaceae bacterium]|tara:strand:- start:18519 stop:18842 length:324 start_codon:yes stop_codon:yes gene_type:complete